MIKNLLIYFDNKKWEYEHWWFMCYRAEAEVDGTYRKGFRVRRCSGNPAEVSKLFEKDLSKELDGVGFMITKLKRIK